MRLALHRRRHRFRRPLTTAYAKLIDREVLLVEVTDGKGGRGLGEAAPLEPFDGVPLAAVAGELQALSQALADEPPPEDLEGVEELVGRIRRLGCGSHTAAALSTALLDLIGKRRRLPLHRLLGAAGSRAIAVNAPIDAVDPHQAAALAREATARGFSCLKVKVGVGDDIARVQAIRKAAPRAAVRLDANGGWSETEAQEALDRLEELEIELCEEPVHGLRSIAALQRKVAMPLVADESAPVDPGEAVGIGGLCLRLGRCGGPLALLGAARKALAAGMLTYIASTYDGPVGLAAALHVAAALAEEGPLPPCGLATGELFAAFAEELLPRKGVIRPPSGPGLGLGGE